MLRLFCATLYSIVVSAEHRIAKIFGHSIVYRTDLLDDFMRVRDVDLPKKREGEREK